jgi:hypothetical protein
MRRARALLVVLAMLVSTLALTGPAAADPPSLDTFDRTYFDCGFEAEFGFVELHAGMEVFEEGADEWVDVIIFSGDDFIYPEWPYPMSFGDGLFSAEMTLFSEMLGGPVGTATVAGTYEQIGDLELVEEWSGKFGNTQEEGRIYYAPLAVAGDLMVDLDGFAPVTFDLSDCAGEHNVEEIWHTNPQAFVFRHSGTNMFCELEADGWFVGMFGFDEDFGGWLELEAWGPDAEEMPTYFGFLDDPDLSAGNVYLEVPLWEPMMEDPTEVAIIDATLSEGAFFDVQIRFMEGYEKVEVYELITEGTLTLPGGVVFDMSTCEGELYERRVFFNDNLSNGKGKAPANDLPDGAIELTKRDSVQTRMAAEEPEAACIDPEWGEIPLGKTVWYTVEGTGEPMTVDTSGSDFDTVAGAYTMEGDEYIQQACLDDNIDETQFHNVVALTFDTIEGELYYVQIGGFAGQYGHLKVELY